jgi:hypothetical protein
MRDVNPDEVREVEFSGLAEVGTFSIKANAKAFRLLIDGLYSDKPRAIIRELWSNAFDSHIAAGIMDTPFYCRLPTKLEPTFSVRDYGVSLTHDQVMHLYTTVFESTKDDSNAVVGKFGLGSKTPFAYTDSYSVTAWLDGKKRAYNAFIDEKGIPRIALFYEEDSDEPQGVEVSFAIKDVDIQTFAYAAQRVVQGFDVPPKCNVELNKNPREIVLQGPNWSVGKLDRNAHNTDITVRQGCVLYPVDIKALKSKDDEQVLEMLVGLDLRIEMPIGTVDITPSRETLSYDDTTCANILKVTKEVGELILAEAQKKIDAAPTLWEAALQKSSIMSGVNSYGRTDYYNKKLTWRGRPLNHTYVKVSHFTVERLAKMGLVMHEFYSRGRHRVRNGFSFKVSDFLPKIAFYPPGKAPKYVYQRIQVCNPDLVIKDFDVNSPAATRLFVAMGRPSKFKEMFKDLNEVEYTPPERKKREARKAGLIHRWYGAGSPSDILDDEAFYADTSPTYYVHTFNGVPKNGEKDFDGVGEIWSIARRIDLVPENARLIGIPRGRKDILKELPTLGWTDFLPLAKEELAKSEVLEPLSKGIAYKWWRVNVSQGWRLRLHAFIEKAMNKIAKDVIKSDTSRFKSLVEMIEPYRTAYSLDADLIYAAICDLTDTKPDANSVKHDADAVKYLEKMHKRLMRAYPLLQTVIDQTDGTVDEALVNYINMVDAVEDQKRAYDVVWS